MTTEGKSAPRKRGRGRSNNRSGGGGGGGGGRRKQGPSRKKDGTDVMHEEFARQAEMARMEARREKEEGDAYNQDSYDDNGRTGPVDDETAARLAAKSAEPERKPAHDDGDGETATETQTDGDAAEPKQPTQPQQPPREPFFINLNDLQKMKMENLQRDVRKLGIQDVTGLKKQDLIF